MAQTIKTIFNSQISRFCRQHMIVRTMCGNNKELTKQIQPVGTDFLLQNLKNASNTKSVLDMVSMHNSIMNNKHIIQALRSLFTLQKCGSSDLSTAEILGHPDFRKLCRQLRNQAGSIELNETIEALKVVSYVGVSANSTIVQVLLQLIRHNINHLSLQQIMFLDFLLSQFSSSPLVDALKIALPMVFEIHLPMKMDFDNVSHLADYLFFASRNNLSEGCIAQIVKVLIRQSSEFDVKTAKSLVWSICDMEQNDLFKPLMQAALKSLNVHLDELTYNDMETTVSKLISRYSKKSTYFYDEVFFDSCANYVIDNNMGFKHSIYVLRKFARVGHCNNFLLDYMSKQVYDNPDYILKGDVVDIYSIVVSVALTEYRPVHWDNLKQLIAKTENMAHSDRREIIWIKFASSLCLLDIYKLDILSKCLSEEFLSHLFRKKFLSDFENLTTAWQCIKMYNPELSSLLPPRFSPDILINRFKFLYEFPLKNALQKALGGEKYVKTDLSSRLGIQIDHLVVFRKGGYPVAMNIPEDVEFIEDIVAPPESQLVVIQALTPIKYTLNNRHMKCSTLFSQKLLESNGYVVVPICLEIWESLPDFEKIPYLMQAIKDRIDTDLSISENVI